MADAWMLLDVQDRMQEQEDIEEQADRGLNNLREVRRRLRDSHDAFDVAEPRFIELFRVSRQLAMDLIVEFTPQLEKPTANGLSSISQVLCALRFFAVGSYQRAIGQDFLVGMSQSAVSRCIHDVTTAIQDRFFAEVIKFPATPVEREAAREKFRLAPQSFPGAIGVIDCTHVLIAKPIVDEVAYLNHHGNHSINVQIICDPDMFILNINARFGGARHDAAIWAQSPARLLMELHHRRGERGTWLLGDSGYPLEPWLMTPILHAEAGTPEFQYTARHCSARSAVERCNRRLKGIWRCLSRERILNYQPEVASRIINACATLHNMRLQYKVGENLVEAPEDADDNVAEFVLADQLEGRERLAQGRLVREQIVRDHFV